MTLAAAVLTFAVAGLQPSTASFTVRGQTLELHLYGKRGGPPVVLASGDGGWLHLAPQCAVILAARGYFVVGLDTKQYLSAFTRHDATLRPADVPGDFKSLVDYAARGASRKPVLAGVSEGAGLAVLAAVDPLVKPAVLGVVGLGLPDENELGWRFRDSLIYLTHKAPKEPSFSVVDVVARLAPLPLAQIHSTHDEYVPLEEARRVYERAGAPKRLWVIEAGNHRFSDQAQEFSQRLLEAMQWVAGAAGGPTAVREPRPVAAPRPLLGAAIGAAPNEEAKGMKVNTVLAALALTAVAVTAGAETKSDFDKEYDFAKLKTFDFKPQARPAARDPHGPNDLWNRRIRADLSADLAANGFQVTGSGSPDFLIAYYMGAKERVDVRTVGYGFPGWGRHRWAWGTWGPDFDVWNIPYTQSTLVVDIIDAHTNMLVWRGYDTDQIDINKADKTIDKTVENLVKRFVKETRENS